MVALKNTFLFVVLAAFASTSQAGPLKKRIAQTIADATQAWQQACLTAGGGQQCNPLSVSSMATLLAGAGACDQQNAGDQMIDLAKTLKNNQQMIALTQVFVQQPRNSPNSLQIPYCQQAPKNTELNGLFQCQFDGTSNSFVGGLQAGAPGTVPFGLKSLKTAKACPANPGGGVADGTQLVAITQNPGLGNIQALGGSAAAGGGGSGAGGNSTPPANTAVAAAPASATPASGSGSGSGSSSGGNFHLQNGQDAQKLNAQFQTLTASSSCTANQDACVQGQFAQCVGGKFVSTPCGGAGSGEICAALPLVNKAGTSVTCTTQQDALQRIAATGAQGGLTG